jgi:hypothetical protein
MSLTTSPRPGASGRRLPQLTPPLAVLCMSLGVAVMALASVLGFHGESGAGALFWLGVLTIFVPAAVTVVSADTGHYARVGIALWLGVSLYSVKLVSNAAFFRFFDEFSHTRTALDILSSGRLFEPNPLLPVSPAYPGLEVVTATLAHASDTTIFVAGCAVLLAARVVLVGALFFLFRELSGASRTASLATLIYACNSSFLFFDSQFSYESLALPLAVTAVWLSLRSPHSRSIYVLLLPCLAAVAVTHHVTSALLCLTLGAWCGIAWLQRHFGGTNTAPWQSAAVALVCVASWVVLGNAHATIHYLIDIFRPAGQQALELAQLHRAPKSGFSTLVPDLALPTWERAVGIGAVVLVAATIPLGLGRLRPRWTTLNPFIGVLAIAAVLYPVVQLMRFTAAGTETAGRSVEFLFIGVAFVVATGIEPVLARWQARLGNAVGSGPVVVALTVVFMGGIALPWAPYARTPGPYLPAADARSVMSDTTAAALWMKRTLGPGHRIIADRVSSQIFGSFGGQLPQRGTVGAVSVAEMFFTPSLTADGLRVLHDRRIEYLVVDMRIARGLPVDGYYFDTHEPGARTRRVPISRAALSKFSALAGVRRVFDGGPIAIYDVRGLERRVRR